VLCSEQSIDITAHDEATLSAILSCVQRKPLRVWLKLDSGMHRMGFGEEAFLQADRLLSKNQGILELIHMTHFSCADHASEVSMERQLARFWGCHRVSSGSPTSLANSAALLASRATHGDWVRPGIMLYGINPLGERHPLPLRRAMQVAARVIAIREIGPQESVGYNERWISERPSRIATVGIGYADGYPRHAPNGTPVWVNGHTSELVGQVSMDSLTVDVTAVPNVEVGNDATLWGSEVPVESVALRAGTIPYQLLVSLHQRVAREYQNAA
jgi:alanine racemase